MNEPTKRVVRIGRRGELILPAPIRKALRLEEGGRVEMQLADGKVILEPKPGLGTSLWGICKAAPDSPSTEEVFRELDEAGEV